MILYFVRVKQCYQKTFSFNEPDPLVIRSDAQQKIGSDISDYQIYIVKSLQSMIVSYDFC